MPRVYVCACGYVWVCLLNVCLHRQGMLLLCRFACFALFVDVTFFFYQKKTMQVAKEGHILNYAISEHVVSDQRNKATGGERPAQGLDPLPLCLTHPPHH